MMASSKPLLLLGVLRKDPVEFYDRLDAIAQVTIERLRSRRSRTTPVTEATAFALLEKTLSADIKSSLDEDALRTVSHAISARISGLGEAAPFHLFHNGDAALGRLCYAVSRMLRPAVVLETGVAYGVTSSFILQALEVNCTGALYSIDLPPLGINGDDYVGALIPENLRKRWHLFRGASKRIIPRLLPDIGQVDLFVHDSLHTRRNMKMEFNSVWPRLNPGGVLISDDIEGNRAFEELAEQVKPALAVAFAEEGKSAFCGLMVKN
jgi:predicted O-methyltransferase YrrM